MDGLLVRVAADQSRGGGMWNGPVNSVTNGFVYVPIPEGYPTHSGLSTLYSDPSLHSALAGIGTGLPIHLCGEKTHLDPDFSHLTYGDSDSRAAQIQNKLKSEDLLVFYGSLRDVSKSDGQLVYALIGLYVIDTILVSTAIPRAQWHENAHTRRMGSPISIRLLSVRVPV